MPCLIFSKRKGWDSNPRSSCPDNTLARCRFRPLSHLSLYKIKIFMAEGVGFLAKGTSAPAGAEPTVQLPRQHLSTVAAFDHSATFPHYFLFFKISSKYFLPWPDFKKPSLLIASARLQHSSWWSNIHGRLPDVYRHLPLLCSFIRLTTFTVWPTYLVRWLTLCITYTKYILFYYHREGGIPRQRNECARWRRTHGPLTKTPVLKIGGEGEIRTHGDIAAPTVFKTAAFDRSATSP